MFREGYKTKIFADVMSIIKKGKDNIEKTEVKNNEEVLEKDKGDNSKSTDDKKDV